VVRPGETLWGVALRLAPESDTRVVVAQIMSLNNLRTPSLVPGQTLLLP
jgi:LysM repeat protein